MKPTRVDEQASLPDSPRLLFAAEVARRFGVKPKTVNRWGNTGEITVLRTPGGRMRFFEAEIKALLAAATDPRKEI